MYLSDILHLHRLRDRAQLNTVWPASVIDPNTARYNREVWESMGLDKYPALQYARTVTAVDGHKADIPNLQQLIRIFCMADVIDANDPTVAANPDLRLAGWKWTNNYAWSSSECAADTERVVGYLGQCNNATKGTKLHAAIPVLELRLDAWDANGGPATSWPVRPE